MQLVLQRVRQASLSIENREVTRIGLGFTAKDEVKELVRMAQTVVHLDNDGPVTFVLGTTTDESTHQT